MWRLKLRLESDKQVLGILAIKHNLSIIGYPLSYWKDKKSIYVITAGFVVGDADNIEDFKKEIRENKAVVDVEWAGYFGILTIKQPLFSEPAYNPQVIRPTPVIVNKEKYHLWDLASFDRAPLENVLKFAEKNLGAKIISFKKESISNISFTKLLPELTNKQKKAIDLAIAKGYYSYPKKIKMENLAKIMGISYSTYQAHLKKAEGKLIPEILKEV